MAEIIKGVVLGLVAGGLVYFNTKDANLANTAAIIVAMLNK